MSYDFDLYTSRALELEPLPTLAQGAVHVDGPYLFEPADIPDNHAPLVEKKRFLFRIHLEGVLATQEMGHVDAWLGQVVLRTKGVLINLQTNQFETPTKSGQLNASVEPVRDSGWMTFYFQDGEAFYEHGFENMLQDISSTLPEAMPNRYGYYEPLQCRIEGGDFSGLISSFKKETDVCMKSRSPFGDILLTIPCRKTFERYHPHHFIRRKFLLGRVSFQIRPKLFDSPSETAKLTVLFEKLCVTLEVVYAEIVRADEFGSWFWYGLPDHQAHTFCLGPAYHKVWPDIGTVGYTIGHRHHVVTTDRFGNSPPRPPNNLIAPEQEDSCIDPETGKIRDTRDQKPKYAPVFPFDYEFDLNTYIW
ncbi:hypothetical protein [uncultured Aliiroseovarius sp.]|uniref:hypothetical protein n=1 Tax=uncultured Aliiroseovarius sp. TaxID=1658783 RepID=UPI002591946E|nr:hypothetical protein [uncultured Aliiroseovarius sp.]